MGSIIPARNYSKNNNIGLINPIIYCCPFCGEDNAFSLNLLLAKRLAECRPRRRSIRMESIFTQVLDEFPDNIVIKDFDVIFNPEYKVDVLRILIAACKKKPFSVIWPGKYEDGKLIYADDGYPDFKTFRIEDYDITCIV